MIYTYLWSFFIVACVGWILEVAYAAIVEKRFVNRGFLNGPICPIYGIGLVIMDLTLGRIHNMAILIIGSAIVGSIVEFVAGYLLEKVFKQKWWDYSNIPHNLKGYVCLRFSIIWGFAGAIVVRILMPSLKQFISIIPHTLGIVLLCVFMGIFLVDFVLTIVAIAGLNRRLKNLETISKKLRDRTDIIGEAISDGVLTAKDKYDDSELKEKYGELNEKTKKDLEELREKYEKAVKKNVFYTRILRAFPNLNSPKHNEQLEELRQKFNILKKKSSDIFKKRNEDAIAAYESKVPEGEKPPFAHGMCFTKLFWVFFIGSIVGFILETLWTILVPPHHIEVRMSLVYGPFVIIYGLGAVLMTLCLYKLYKQRDIWIFLFSMVIGGTFEYMCSFLQEKIFGTVSWDYSDAAFNINGRTSLQFCIFWGILGMLWVKDIYPRISKLIEKIPRKLGKTLTVLLVIFMAVDMLLSAGAVLRRTERDEGVPATNFVQEFFDKNFTDDELDIIYPNMKKVGTPGHMKIGSGDSSTATETSSALDSSETSVDSSSEIEEESSMAS